MKINKRYIGAAMLAPFIIFVFLGGLYLKGFTIVLSIAGLYEFYKVAKISKIKTLDIFGYALLLLFYLSNNNFEILAYILILAAFFMMCIPVIKHDITYIDVSVTLLGFIYVGVFFSFIYLVNNMKDGNYLVWLIFIASWLCDTAAYYSGRLFGKHKLNPEVSAKKTIEGSIGGLIGASAACGIYGLVLINQFNVTDISLIHYFVIGAICGVFSQFGDLVASSIKRHSGVKDYSNLIPGHGGILDRFDSILYSSVVIFIYLKFIIML